MSKIRVLGGGSWGTTLAVLLAEKGNDVKIWEFNKEQAEKMQETRVNDIFMGGLKLPDNLEITSNLEGFVCDADFILFAVPSQFLRDVLEKISKDIKKNHILINVSKGIEIKNHKRMSQVIMDEILGKYHSNIVILTGPTHAEEVAQKKPSAIVAASNSLENAKKVQSLFNAKHFRVYSSTDLVGAELGGALKNCIAIAAGITDGMGLGDNTKSALMTRGLAEMMRFGEYFGAERITFSGLAGIGDLITTCTSKHGRNRYVGEEIGKGRKVKEILSSMRMIAEGVPTVKAVYEIAKENEILVPIIDGLYKVLYEDMNPQEIISMLMGREVKEEF